MNQRALFAAAAATVLSSALLNMAPAAAQDMGKDTGKEKCYGIAKAGQNDCASLSGSHSCAGQAKTDMSKDEWKYVAKGTCKQMSGLSSDEAKMSMTKKM